MSAVAAVPLDLGRLQDLCKRDPESYEDEFRKQWAHYASLTDVFRLEPDGRHKDWLKQVKFVSHVSAAYPKLTAGLSTELCDLLETHYAVMTGSARRTVLQCLILLRNKGSLAPITLLSLCFTLFRSPDKNLRSMLYTYIVTDIKNINKGKRDNKLNQALQNMLYGMLQDSNAVAAKKSLDVMIELYRRKVWTDAKTVNVIASAAVSKNSPTKSVVAALKFFLGYDDEDEDADDGEHAAMMAHREAAMKHTQISYQVGNKTRKRQRRMSRAVRKVNEGRSADRSKTGVGNDASFTAMQLIYDPYDFAEKIFKRLKKSKERFEARILHFDLISRLIATHRLVMLNFYAFIQRYLQPHQKHISHILTTVVQSCHDQVPPDAMQPLVRTIANNFVTDRNAEEAIVIGLNTIREMCARAPLVMDADLLQDLVAYKAYKRKGVAMAARSILQLFRDVNPALLARRDRGRDAKSKFAPVFGEQAVADHIDGAEFLPVEAPEDGWEVAEGGAPGSGAGSDSDSSWGSLDEEGMAALGMAGGSDAFSSADASGDGGEDDEDAEDAAEAARKAARKVMRSRILTPRDFEMIKQAKARKEAEELTGPGLTRAARLRAAKKRRYTQADLDEEVGLEVIEPAIKRKRTAKEKLEAVMEGREGREKFGVPNKQKSGGTSNKEKLRTKFFKMVRHKKSISRKHLTALHNKNRKKGKPKKFGEKRH